MVNEEFKGQSEYHSAFVTMARMNNLFYLCDFYSGEMDAFNWFWRGLMPLQRELSDDMKQKELDDCINWLNKISDKIDKHTKAIDSNKTGMSAELYKDLDAFEKVLRQIHRRAGYKTKEKEDARHAI